MSKKIFNWLLATFLMTSVSMAEAQQPKKIPRIGFLGLASAANFAPRIHAFLQGLQELGYVEGKSIFIEYRYADGRLGRLSELAAELVRLNVDVIVTHGSANQAAKEATTTIPIVMALSGDAVGTGLVASLARPGGNVTGLTSISAELYGKRLELLRELIPKLSQVAVMFSESSSGTPIAMKETQLVASSLGVRIQSFGVRSPNDFESAFDAAIKGGAGALIMLQGPITSSYRKQHIDLALKKRLPAIYNEREWVEAGGLVAYGANYLDMYRRAATYVDKILKGTKPGDLPVEQASKFELVINLKTAKQIGLTIPPNVLARADKVIR